ncbi:hypothetical protein TI03_03160 [Achromatium sp. WMS1]|nr:hypothetical protein TI03_03160 [Achromatium sp. WMS1]
MDPSVHKPTEDLIDPTLQEVDWTSYYPDAFDPVDPKAPKPQGVPLTSAVYFDSNWAHDKLTCRSTTSLVGFIGNTPVTWSSKRQGAIATSTYSAELTAVKVGTEEAVSLRYMLHYLGVPLASFGDSTKACPTLLVGDNLGALVSGSDPGSECQKHHVAIAYHYVRECHAAGIVSLKKIHTSKNPTERTERINTHNGRVSQSYFTKKVSEIKRKSVFV